MYVAAAVPIVPWTKTKQRPPAGRAFVAVARAPRLIGFINIMRDVGTQDLDVAKKRSYADDEADSQSRRVAAHYNARPEAGVHARLESPIYPLRSFNNWVKSVLINNYCREGFNVLELACGKGGDLGKWQRARIRRLVGFDIADVSIEQCRNRFDDMRGGRFHGDFHVADCCEVDLSRVMEPGLQFDLVSCQFAFHYSFETESKARRFLHNVTCRLKPGGCFIGTIPNASWIVRRMRESQSLEFGNQFYQIRFEQGEPFMSFGHKYHFNLKDAVDDCPEYLVHFPTLVELARVYGLRLRFRKTFHEFYSEYSKQPSFAALLERMGVVQRGRPFSAELWEAAQIYLAFAFEKVGPSLSDGRN